MSTVTQDIATILEDNGFGTIGVDIFVGEDAPESPDSQIKIISTGTFNNDFPTIDLAYPTVQILNRGAMGSGQACEALSLSIKDFMKTVGNYSVNQARFVYINHLSGPVSLGLDESMRPIFSLNLVCLRTNLV